MPWILKRTTKHKALEPTRTSFYALSRSGSREPISQKSYLKLRPASRDMGHKRKQQTSLHQSGKPYPMAIKNRRHWCGYLSNWTFQSTRVQGGGKRTPDFCGPTDWRCRFRYSGYCVPFSQENSMWVQKSCSWACFFIEIHSCLQLSSVDHVLELSHKDAHQYVDWVETDPVGKAGVSMWATGPKMKRYRRKWRHSSRQDHY